MEKVEGHVVTSQLPAELDTVVQRRRIGDPAARLAGFEEAAAGALDTCERTRGRIREGISLLARDDRAMEAFRFMNRAMWQQRVHTVYAEEVRRGGKPTLERIDRPDNRCWRLFQLAFILLNLPGVTDLHHPDRTEEGEAVADLLWFPTGGGKTEAYLGLTAYTLAMRRLRGCEPRRAGRQPRIGGRGEVGAPSRPSWRVSEALDM